MVKNFQGCIRISTPKMNKWLRKPDCSWDAHNSCGPNSREKPIPKTPTRTQNTHPFRIPLPLLPGPTTPHISQTHTSSSAPSRVPPTTQTACGLVAFLTNSTRGQSSDGLHVARSGIPALHAPLPTVTGTASADRPILPFAARGRPRSCPARRGQPLAGIIAPCPPPRPPCPIPPAACWPSFRR